MSSKILPQPICSITKQPFADLKFAKSIVIINLIQRIAKSCDDLAQELPTAEKTIYFAERLSCQYNIDGVTNFFDYGIAPYYHAVIGALRQLEALAMIELLEGIRKVVMGTHELTADSIHKNAYESYPPPPYENDVSPWEADLECLDSQDADEDFHHRHKNFAASYFDANGYSFQ